MSTMEKKKSKPKQDQKEAAKKAEEQKKAAKKADEEKKAAEKAEVEKKLGESSAIIAKATAKIEDSRSSSLAKGAITLAKDNNKLLKLSEIMTFFRTAFDKEEELGSIKDEIDFQTKLGTVIALKAGEEALKTTESVINLLESRSRKNL